MLPAAPCRSLAAGFAVVVAALAAGPVLAQTGPFVPSQAYFISPLGGPGVINQGSQIWIDVNGSGLQDAGDTFHPVPSGLATGWTLRLTPSRRVMVAFTSTGQVCPGTPTSIRLYTVPLTNGAALAPLGVQQTLSGCIQDVGFFDDPTRAVRTAFFREPADLSGNANILWWDLVTGAAATSPFPYHQGFGFVEFAPWGTMAWVQHTIDNGTNTSAFSIVTLCPPQLGQASQPGLTNQPDVLHAHVEGGGPLVVVARTSGGTQVASFNYTDCALPPPVTGACCLSNGGCLGGTTQSECETTLGGTWQGASSTCAAANCPPPPSAVLAVTKTGPASVPANSDFAYVLTISNSGTLASSGVTVNDFIPTGATFVSASPPGTYNAAQGFVSWNEGTLGPGATVRETLTVHVGCAASSVTNSNYIVFGSPGGFVAGSPAVVTSVQTPSTAPIGMTLATVPSSPPPLHAGDLITFTMQLSNTVAIARTGLSMSFVLGNQLGLDQVVDPGSGTIQVGGSTLTWTGALAAGATTQIVVAARVSACRSASVFSTVFNDGSAITLRNSCSATVGTLTSAETLALAPPAVSAELRHTNSTVPGGAVVRSFAAAGSTLDLEIRLANHEAAAQSPVSIALVIPATLTQLANPPFIGTPPAGATWNPATRTIAWSGALAPLQTVAIPFRGVMDTVACSAGLSLAGAFGGCTNNLFAGIGIWAVHAPPTGGHLLGLEHNRGVWWWDPAAGGARRFVLCGDPGQFETLDGFDVTPNGDIWIAGIPSLRFNPSTLDFQYFGFGFMASLGLLNTTDVAVNPADGMVYFLGKDASPPNRFLLKRWDPATQQVATIAGAAAPDLLGAARLALDADGWMAMDTQQGIVRVNLANPAMTSTYDEPGIINSPTGLTLDTDGAYLVTDNFFGTSLPRPLASVDRATGAFSEVVHDLNPILPSNFAYVAMAVAPNRDVYLGATNGLVAVLHRNPAVAGDTALIASNLADLEWVGGATVGVPLTSREIPTLFELRATAPNPIVSAARLVYALPNAARVRLQVLDLQGRRVARLLDAEVEAGVHSVAWNARDDWGRPLPSGVYFARLESGGRVLHRRVVVAR